MAERLICSETTMTLAVNDGKGEAGFFGRVGY